MKSKCNKFISRFLIFICICLFSFCKKSANAGTSNPPAPPTDTTTYKLVWSDEFDDNSINTANWNFETGGNGWGNNELEYYQANNATI